MDLSVPSPPPGAAAPVIQDPPAELLALPAMTAGPSMDEPPLLVSAGADSIPTEVVADIEVQAEFLEGPVAVVPPPWDMARPASEPPANWVSSPLPPPLTEAPEEADMPSVDDPPSPSLPPSTEMALAALDS